MTPAKAYRMKKHLVENSACVWMERILKSIQNNGRAGVPAPLLFAGCTILKSDKIHKQKVGCGALEFTAFWYVANSYIIYKNNDFCRNQIIPQGNL